MEVDVGWLAVIVPRSGTWQQSWNIDRNIEYEVPNNGYIPDSLNDHDYVTHEFIYSLIV